LADGVALERALVVGAAPAVEVPLERVLIVGAALVVEVGECIPVLIIVGGLGQFVLLVVIQAVVVRADK
jgi:hypothetical protein